MISGRGYRALGPFFVSAPCHVSFSFPHQPLQPQSSRGPPAVLGGIDGCRRRPRDCLLPGTSRAPELTVIPRNAPLGQAGVGPALAQLMAEFPPGSGTKGTQHD
jgi:hypothetical protein